MDRKENLVLVDFDNTLFFGDESLRHAERDMFGRLLAKRELKSLDRRVRFKLHALAYTKYHHLIRPHREMIERVKKIDGAKTIIMSARGESLRALTEALLAEQEIKVDGLLLRNKQEMKMHDEEWKLMQVRHFMRRYRQLSAYEDKLENLEYIRRHINEPKRLHLFLVLPGRVRKIG